MSTPESPQPPPQTASSTPARHGQPRVEPSEDCCVCYETLSAPLVHLRACPHRLHLPCYAALRVGATTDLRCPACRATVTVGLANRRAPQQHSEEVMTEATAVARRKMPTGGGGGSSTRATRAGRGGRVICSICHGLVGERAFVLISCSCEVHRRCALGFVEDAISRARINGVRTVTYQVTCPNPVLHQVRSHIRSHARIQLFMRCTKRWICTPFSNRSRASVNRQKRRRREPWMPRSLQESSISTGGPLPPLKR